MDSRGRLAKRLVRLEATEPIVAGDVLLAAGKKAGTVTSAAQVADKTVALGYVKTKVLEGGGALVTAGGAAVVVCGG